MSLIYNVVVTLALLTCLNFLAKCLLPRFALRQGELLTIYVILSISSAIAGHDMMQTLVHDPELGRAMGLQVLPGFPYDGPRGLLMAIGDAIT